MKNFLLELLHKAIETFVVVNVTVVTKAIITSFVADCKNKSKKKATPTPRKRKKGGSSKK